MRKLITSVALCAFAFANGAYAAGLAPESFNKMYSLAHSGDIYGLREAIHRGLYIDSPNQNGNTGLCVAIYRGDQRAYNTFRAAGANPRHPCTSVIPAAQYNSFMSSGAVVASPNTVPALTYTPIHTGFLYSPRFWTYVGLGAIAIAALAFSGGGGGHKKSSPEPEPEKVDEGLAKLSGTYVVTNRTDEETGEKLPDEDLITTNVSGKDSSKYTITSDDGFSYKEDYADYFSQKNNYRALTNPLQQADRFLVSYKFSDGVLVKTSGQALGFVNLGEIGLAVYGWGKDGVLTKYDASSSFSVESTNAAYGIVAGNLATATLGGMGTIDVQADGDYYWSSAVGMYADTGALIRNKGTINGSSNGDGTAVGMMTMQVIDHHLKKKPSGYGEVITRAVNDGTITMEGKNIVAMGGYMAEPVKGSRSKFDKATLVNNNKINIKSTGTKNELIGDKNTEEASGYRGAVGMRADAVTTATNMGQIALSGGSSSDSGGSGSGDSKEGNMAGMMVVHGGTIVNGYKDYISGKGSDFDPKGIIIVGGTDGIIDDRGNIDIKKIDPTPGYGMVSLAGGLLLKNNPVNNLINYGQIYVLSDGSSAIYVNHYSNVTMGNGSYIYLSRTGTEGKGQTVIENASDREISGTSSGDKIETRGKIEIINTPKKERSDNNPTLTKDVESYVFKGLFKHVYNYADIVFGDPNFMSESITRSEAIFLYDYDNFSGVLHNYGAIEWNSALSAYNETTREGYTNNYLLNGKNYYQETNGSEAGSLTVNTLLMYSKPTAMVAPEILPIDSILYVDGSEIGNTYSVVGKFEYTNNDTKYTKNEGSEEEPDYPYDYGGHPVLIEAEDLDKLTSSADLILHQVAKNTKDPDQAPVENVITDEERNSGDGLNIISAIKATDVDNITNSGNIEVTDASTGYTTSVPNPSDPTKTITYLHGSYHHVHGIYAINTDNYSDMTIKNSGNITVVPTSGASIEYAAIRAIAGNGSDLKTLTINNSGDINAPIGIFATYITENTPNEYLDYNIENSGKINISGPSYDDGITVNSGRKATIINKEGGDISGAKSGIHAYYISEEVNIDNYATINTNVGGSWSAIHSQNIGNTKTIINNYGDVIAYRRGIAVFGGDATIYNHEGASIESKSSYGILVNPEGDNPITNANITNDGDISAYTAGIYVINASGDVNIENNGTVETSSTSGMVYSIYASQVEGDVHIVNNKDIKSSGNLISGIYDYANNSSLIENNGNINIQSTNIGFGIFSTSADTHISNTGSIVSTGTRDMGVFYNAVGDFSLCNGGTFDANGNCIKEDSSAIISSGSYYAVNTGSASTANIYNWGNITSGNSSGIYIPTYTQEANIYNYDSGNITGKIGIESYIYDFDQADISIYNKGNIGNSDTVTGIKLSGGYIYNGVDNPDGDEINKDALITGADYGIYSTDGYDDLYVKNYAKINGNQAIYFDTFDGQQYNSNILNIYNAKDAVIEGETDAIKAFTYGADETVTIYNNGLITASTYGIDVSNGAETGKIKITNGADGIISANYAIFINDKKNTGNPDEDDPSENKGSLELINYGTITSNSGSGVYFSGNSAEITNSGIISSDNGNAIYHYAKQPSTITINNTGNISGKNTAISVFAYNSLYIETNTIIVNGSEENHSATIDATNPSATAIRINSGGTANINNYAKILDNIDIDYGAKEVNITNRENAIISGSSSLLIGSNGPASNQLGNVNIINSGTIEQIANSDNAAITIKKGHDVSISNNSTGVISGYYDGTDYSPAISISGISRKAEITNATTGIINGDIKIEGDYNITSPLSSSDVPGVITVRNNNPDSVVNVLYDDTFNIKTNYAAAMNVYGNVDAHNAGTINVGSSSQSVYNAHGMYAGNGARIYNDSGAVINVYANTNGIEPSGLSVGDNSYGENAGTINVYGNGAFSGIWANSGSEVKNIGKIYINGNNNRAINIRDTGSRAINEGELLLLQSAEALNGILVEEGATGTNASEGIILVGKSNSSALESSNGIYVSSGKGYNSGTITVYGTHTSSDITKLNTGMHANGENSEITNNKDGTIKVYNRYNVGMYAGGKAKSYNEGTIEINSNLGSALPQFQESCGMYATGSNSQANNMATGIINVNQNNSLIVNNNSGMKAKSSATAVNYGTINAKWNVSDENKSPDMLYLTNYGMYASGGTVVNVGDIELDGMTVGMYADNTAGSKAVNYGSIYVGNDAIGMLVGGENATIINNGYIEASGAKAYAVAAVTVNGGVLPNKYSVNGTVINNGVINITNSATGDDKSYLFVALNKDRRVDIGSNNVSETKVYSARNPLQYFTFDAQVPSAANNYSNYTQNQASPTQVKNAKISAYERALTAATTYGLDTAEIYKNLCALDPSHYGCPVSTPSGAPAANTMSLGAGKTLMLSSAPRALTATAPVTATSDTDTNEGEDNTLVAENEEDDLEFSTTDDTPAPATLGKSAKVVSLSGGSTFVNNGLVVSDEDIDFDEWAEDDESSVQVSRSGTFAARSLKGTVVATADIVTSETNENEYETEGSFIGDTEELTVESGSYLFSASLANTGGAVAGIRMTMKDFEDVKGAKGAADFLDENYNNGNRVDMFNRIKAASNQAAYEKVVNEELGLDFIPTLAKQNIEFVRDTSGQMTDSIFENIDSATRREFITGIDYYHHRNSSYEGVMSYDSDGMNVYGVYDEDLTADTSVGLGFAIGTNRSEYDDDSTARQTTAQVYVPVSFAPKEFSFVSMPRFGAGVGKYKRRVADDSTHQADLTTYYYGISNQARKKFEFGGIDVEPTAEFNVLGMYMDKIKERENLYVKSQNDVSVEGGLGLYIGKTVEFANSALLKLRLGGTYYRELADPYRNTKAGFVDADGTYEIKGYNAKHDRGVISLKADYNFALFDLYIKASEYIESNSNFAIQAGMKYSF